MTPILELKNLSLGYGLTVFSNLNLLLLPGQFVTIMGENGAGKTTLVDALQGYLRPTSGDISFWGTSVDKIKRQELHKRVGWVISRQEDYPLGQTIAAFFRAIAPLYPSWDHEFTKDLAARFHLDLSKKLSHLSLGENSKVKLIKALAFHPELLVLDELTANLSEDSKRNLLTSLLNEFSSRPMSVLYFSHSSEEAAKLSDEAYSLSAYGLVKVGV